MEKQLKIQDLEVGKIYKFYIDEEAQEGVYKINKEKQLIISVCNYESQTNLGYNVVINGYFTEIEREIDWTKVPRGTKVQVRDEKEDEWLNRYFLKIVKEEYEEDYFEVALCEDNNFTGCKMEDYCSYWKYCRVHESVLIPDEWYKEVE